MWISVDVGTNELYELVWREWVQESIGVFV